ncbi:MAG: hypothetical protein QW780_04980 [Sulfolobales archaeon]
MRREFLNKVVADWARKFYSRRMLSITELFKNDKAIIGWCTYSHYPALQRTVGGLSRR